MSKGKARSVEPVYISAGCNRYSNVADVNQYGLVAYGAGKLIALWNSEDDSSRGVYATLPGHQGTVTVVKFLKSSKHNARPTFFSGDTSGTAIVWSQDDAGEWTKVATLSHTASIGALASFEVNEDSHLLAVGTSDTSMSIYSWEGLEAPKLLQKLDLKRTIPMDAAFSFLPNSKDILLTIGGTDKRIFLYTCPAGSQTFSASVTLPGHTDWVRCLSFCYPLDAASGPSEVTDYRDGDILLASGSQDNYIRLWKFTQSKHTNDASIAASSSSSPLDILDSIDDIQDGEIAAKQYLISVDGRSYACTSESVLLGHDNWVTGVHWRPPTSDSSVPALLSASADRSMIMWTHDSSSSLWLSNQRFGELGGTNLGFFGALWGKDAETVLAHGWGGSFHCWRRQGGVAEQWKPVIPVTGHFEKVTSLAWELNGDYLVSVGADQTARLHAPWKRNSKETWHELCRPQIHGYDMEDVAFLSRTRLISGSEEKIVRVFDAPGVFVRSMASLGTCSDLEDDGERPNAATIPALGLSNKAVFGTQGKSELNGTATGGADTITFQALQQPPFEEQLLTSTLWPETEKLYAHGYEINAIAASHDGQLIASACRSTTAEHAVLRLHRTDTWAQVLPPLAGHTLTVTRIVFSPDDKYILSVSRDRSWQMYFKGEDGQYQRVAHLSKAHARIIWDAAWSDDGSIFATASRDKQVKIWHKADNDHTRWTAAATLSLSEAATAVSFTSDQHSRFLAVGNESGLIQIYSASLDNSTEWTRRLNIDSDYAHTGTVRRLAWQPNTKALDGELPLLASCSEDHSVRVTEVTLHEA